MKSQLADHELVMQFINGRQSGIETLIHRHKSKVFTYISMYIRDSSLAEDIFQDTFMKVINSLRSGKYKDNGNFYPGLCELLITLL